MKWWFLCILAGVASGCSGGCGEATPEGPTASSKSALKAGSAKETGGKASKKGAQAPQAAGGDGKAKLDAPAPAPKACLPFGGEAGGWPGLGDPEEELDVDAMDFDFGGDPLLPRSRAPSAGSWADLGSQPGGRAPSGSWGDLGDGPAPFTLPPSPARPVPAPARRGRTGA